MFQLCILGSSKQLTKISTFSLSPITFNTCKLEWCNTVKNLDVRVDSALFWTSQISELGRKFYCPNRNVKI